MSTIYLKGTKEQLKEDARFVDELANALCGAQKRDVIMRLISVNRTAGRHKFIVEQITELLEEPKPRKKWWQF